MGVLSTGSPTALFPVQCTAYPGRVARQLGRDIRTDTSGDPKAQSRTCTSVDAMSGSGCSPTSGQRTRGSPGI